MLGYWNRSVYITYLGVFVAVMGLLMFSKTGNADYAFVGIIISCICDMFDGKVARGILNRTDKEKEFGVQIDSLADSIAFVVVPALTLYKIGLNHTFQMIILSLYIIVGIVRLAYFNVCMSDKDKAIKEYQGLPVPVVSLVYGLIWVLAKVSPTVCESQVAIYTAIVPVISLLHITNFKIKKFTGAWFYITVSVVLLLVAILGAIIL